MSSVATASWSLDRLVSSLARGGWGDTLDGRHNQGLRRVMHALASMLPWEAAEGRLTRAQVADAAGLSPKWAGKCLARLEDLGLIVWHRGWLHRGQPRPGWIRVQKTRLAELVRGVRGYLDHRRQARREATRARLETTLTHTSVPPWKRAKRLAGPMGTECPPSHHRSTGATRPGLQTPLPTSPEGADMPLCAICGRYEDACRRANQLEPFAISHQYEPGRAGTRHQIVAPAHELHPKVHKRATKGWRQLVAELNRPAHPTLDLGGDQ